MQNVGKREVIFHSVIIAGMIDYVRSKEARKFSAMNVNIPSGQNWM